MQVYISEKFLDQNGLGVFERWLSKVPVGDHGEMVEPSIALRKGIFEVLLSLNVRNDHIVRAEELQRIIQRNKRSQTKELRDLSEQLISKWSQVTYEEEE